MMEDDEAGTTGQGRTTATGRVRGGVSRSYASENMALESLGDQAEREAAERRRQRKEARQLKIQEKIKQMQQEEKLKEDKDYQAALKKAKRKAEEARERRKKEGAKGDQDVVAILQEVETVCETIKSGPDSDNSSVQALQSRIDLLSSHLKNTILHVERLQTHKISAQYQRETLREKLTQIEEQYAEAKVSIQKLKDKVVAEGARANKAEASAADLQEELAIMAEKMEEVAKNGAVSVIESGTRGGDSLHGAERGSHANGNGTQLLEELDPVKAALALDPSTITTSRRGTMTADADGRDNREPATESGSSRASDDTNAMVKELTRSYEEQLDQVRAKLDVMTSLRDELQAENARLVEEVARLKQHSAEVEADNSSLKTQLASASKGDDGSTGGHNADKDSSTTKTPSANNEGATTNDDAMNTSIELFTVDIDAAKTRIVHLERQNKTLRATIKELEEAEESQRSEARRLKRECSRIKTEKEFLDEKLALKDAQLKKLRERRREEIVSTAAKTASDV